MANKTSPTSQAPQIIHDLVEKFAEHSEHYKRGDYNETQLRQDFLDPFFEALGWDVANRQGYAEAYRDVILEHSLRVEQSVRAPDYCFRIGGTPKFFVEAKKPSVDIKSDVGPAFQLRRYAWTAKLPLSILTDFEELAVYDCRIKPDKNDKASTARVLFIQFTEYAERWDEIVGIFARESVLRGSFDKYAESNKKKRGTAEVDDAFLEEIEQWRESLARNLSLRNESLTDRELNFSVQRIIDRIIFLRMCEGREIEPYGRLQSLINGSNCYRRLVEMFQRADEKYNSGLFHFQKEKGREPPDELTTNLIVDDKVIKEIVRRLYYPESPYEFAALPADILGQVYEQFLGKVIRLTAGHRAKIEAKPEVRKAGGVYYTPTYIVDYIVENTVGKLVEGKTPQQVGALTKTFKESKKNQPLSILDPACGSGSFLIVAYQYLLDWYLQQYTEEDDPAKHTRGANPRIYQAHTGDWRLTTTERKRILLAHIYGVDIDFQAVEVTKLSLLLKVLEGETEETLQRQLFAKDRALPDLANNIKCGNSLIGPDFYRDRQGELFDEEETLRINAFDWQSEFKHIFAGKSPGFDAVIGNPPYIRVRALREIVGDDVIDYLQNSYRCTTHVWDIYLLFYERAVEITSTKGRFGFIIPIQTLHQPNCESLRRLLLSKTKIETIADLSAIRIFQGAIVKNCIIICSLESAKGNKIQTCRPKSKEAVTDGAASTYWPQSRVKKNPSVSFKLDLLSPIRDVCQKLLDASWELRELCYVTFGLRSCAKGKGQGGKERLIVVGDHCDDKRARLYLEGREITRYNIRSNGRRILYLPDEMYSPRTPELFETKKIVSQTMLSKMRLVATLDSAHHYVEQSLLCVVPHGIVTQGEPPARYALEFILGLMNSKLESFFFATYIIDYSLGGGLIHATPGSQGKLIIPKVSPTHDNYKKVVSFVQQMLDLHKRLPNIKTSHERTAIERQLAATDREIDQLVYQLYGLTDKEIQLVEEATG